MTRSFPQESKGSLRKQLRELPIAEKLRIVEQLAERQKLIKSATDPKDKE